MSNYTFGANALCITGWFHLSNEAGFSWTPWAGRPMRNQRLKRMCQREQYTVKQSQTVFRHKSDNTYAIQCSDKCSPLWLCPEVAFWMFIFCLFQACVLVMQSFCQCNFQNHCTAETVTAELSNSTQNFKDFKWSRSDTTDIAIISISLSLANDSLLSRARMPGMMENVC